MQTKDIALMRCFYKFVTIALFCLLALSGCAFGGKGRSLNELDAPEGQQEYLIRKGDTLAIKVWGESRLSGKVFVRDDGHFTMELINDVAGAGKTLPEVTEDVTTRLAEFVPGASVTISVARSAPIRFYLSGAFSSPGEYSSEGSITLLQAIATGGGFAPFADESNVVLIRKSAQQLRYTLDYNRVVDGKEPNPELRDGDVIVVR
jgi:polysaccharide export outer membrane protein